MCVEEVLIRIALWRQQWITLHRVEEVEVMGTHIGSHHTWFEEVGVM